MLIAEHIYFSYDKPVIVDISLKVEQGSLVVLIGPNGSGKSTLMKLLAGLLQPTQGKVFFNNHLLKEFSRREIAKQIAYVAQETKVEFPLSAFEFVLQGRFAYGRAIGFEQAQDLEIADKVMQLTDISNFKERQLNALSGGEQPKLLLLDEPTANLDISHQVTTLKLLKELIVKEKLTVFLITHELNLASEFADQILLLKSGKMIAYGQPDEVLVKNTLEQVFETSLLVDKNPFSGRPRLTITTN
jgi:iron complex transport system ATP-binding protein